MYSLYYRLFISFIIMAFTCMPCNAQFAGKLIDIMKSDSSKISKSDSLDLLYQKRLQEKDSLLQASQLHQANIMLENEALKSQLKSSDSLRRAKLKLRVDSLRSKVKGVPVVVSSDTLFYIYAKRGGNEPQSRAESIVSVLEKLGKKYSSNPDSIYIENSDIQSDIMYKDQVVASVTDLDGIWANESREQLAEQWREKIVAGLKQLKKDNSILRMVKRIALFALTIIGQILICILINRLYRILKKYIISVQDKRLRPLRIRDYELLNVNRVSGIIIFGVNVVRYIIITFILLITVPVLFAIFPRTEDLALKIFTYLWNPTRSVLVSIRDYLPNMFTIGVIAYCIHLLMKGIRYLLAEIAAERLKLPGFYPDWAQPTYHIVRFLLYAFMIAMIYPYLPGSNSKVFQGVSVFLGLIVSLGSSTLISNIISGLIITYMRPFRIGDRIKLNDIEGFVMEKTTFVTRLKTFKNEVVTIPNSFFISSHSTNYSVSAKDYGLIIHTTVTIGYDVPWRKVHELLISAAKVTPGVQAVPEPYVLETGLNDWYPVYQINACIQEADKQPRIMSALIQNIQDMFDRAGVEILSPTYIATRDGNASTVETPPADAPSLPTVDISSSVQKPDSGGPGQE